MGEIFRVGERARLKPETCNRHRRPGAAGTIVEIDWDVDEALLEWDEPSLDGYPDGGWIRIWELQKLPKRER